jgi:hypothetical protein
MKRKVESYCALRDKKKFIKETILSPNDKHHYKMT